MENNRTAQAERSKIERMYDAAEAKRDWPGSYFPAVYQARAALSAWRAKYPREAARENASNLRAQADALKLKALRALTYDADGVISADEQRKRHDEWMEQAASKIAAAEQIEQGN